MNPMVITVKETAPPKQGRKQGNVFDTTGKRWGVDVNMLGRFVPGNSYSLDKVSTNNFNGQTYYTIEAFTPISGVTQIPSSAPAPVAQPSVAYSNKDEQIFVCGILNNLAGNPAVNWLAMSIDDRIQIIEETRYMWKVTFGGQPRQRTQTMSGGDMNDSIPF